MSQDDIGISPTQEPTVPHVVVPSLDLYSIDGKHHPFPDNFVLGSNSATDTPQALKSTSSITIEEKPNHKVKKLRRRKHSSWSRRKKMQQPRLHRRWSIHEDPNEEQPRGIYWPSPISMAMFFISGFLACLAHHLVYRSLDRQEVGSDSQQQWVLRHVLGWLCSEGDLTV